jgi:hypothetical protein
VKNMMKITINVPVKIMWVIIAVWQYWCFRCRCVSTY